MSADEVGFSQSGQHGEKRLSASDFIPKTLKRMRQRVADGPTQCSQPKGVQEGFHLVPNPHGTVLQILVVKTQPGIDEAFAKTASGRHLDLALKEVAHAWDRIIVDRNVLHFPDIFSRHIANDHRCIVIGG